MEDSTLRTRIFGPWARVGSGTSDLPPTTPVLRKRNETNYQRAEPKAQSFEKGTKPTTSEKGTKPTTSEKRIQKRKHNATTSQNKPNFGAFKFGRRTHISRPNLNAIRTPLGTFKISRGTSSSTRFSIIGCSRRRSILTPPQICFSPISLFL